jgi:acetyl esterase/lipase
VAGAGFTLNALRPIKGGRVLLVPAFLSSWLVGEAVAHHFAWQLAATILFAWAGALGHWPGWVGLTLTLVSWATLGVLWRRGASAKHVVRQSLQGFAAADEWPQVPWTKLWLPLSMGRRGVRRVRDVEYGRVGKKRLKLDVFLPPERRKRRPAVLQIHGGGWVLGTKREQGLPLLNHLASHGWVGFNADYRLSPRATFPDQLVDIKRALAWIREHADEYGVDPSFIAVTGGSAGGHLTALMALTQNETEYQPGFENADTSVQAAVPFYGVYCFVDRLGLYSPGFFSMLLEPLVMKQRLSEAREAFERASPLDRLTPEAPPFFVVHGDRDTLAPVEYARLFVDELRKTSNAPVLYAELPGAQHAFDIFYSPRSVRALEAVERFLDEAYRRSIQGRAARKATEASTTSRPGSPAAVTSLSD